ncbi:MAG TPA: hypothetical protein IAA21_09510 [Candidatus Blautia faecigallinarum]|uniref:ATPase n=1 Tax=Candidatus Blautia faecigallinarum TaxID=2838488 RepID=A0A9D2DU29_9FIRM|nr:hypothetical protein [Candidatus Blautia faecigallinarum]
MEEILQKLSEIELTAASIMTDAEKTKTSLSEELEKRCRDFDTALEKETAEKISHIRSNLEKDKDAQLTKLRQDTESYLEHLDSYFKANHQRLSEELFHKLLES